MSAKLADRTHCVSYDYSVSKVNCIFDNERLYCESAAGGNSAQLYASCFFYLIFIYQCTHFVVLLVIVLLLSFAIGSVIITSHKSVIDGELPDIY